MLVTAAVTGAVLALAAPAHAAPLGTVNLSATSGSVTASPMFARAVTSVACPSTFGEEAALRVGPANTGPFANLSPIVGGGGFDTHPVTIDPNRSMQAALGAAPTDGTYWVVVECFSLTAGRHPDRFVTPIRVTGGNWETIQPAADTTTALAVSPASPQPVGTAVTLTATVTPNTVAGSVSFKNGAATIGTATVSGGTASTTVSTLPVGSHALTAVFTPTDTVHFNGSTSAPVSYQITAPAATATTTALAVAPASPQPQGTELTLTATVTPVAAAGSVAFRDGTTDLGTATVSGGTAELKTTALAAGDHSLKAVFTPADAAAFAGSESAPVSFVVSQPPADDDLTVTDENGTVLGANPSLHRGQKVHVTARGFAGNEEVAQRLDGAQAATDTAADGLVTGDFEVPDDAALGAHRLTIKGAEHEVVFDFTVVETPPPPGGGGGLPVTGTDVALIAASGVALVAGGGVLMLVRRRRTSL